MLGMTHTIINNFLNHVFHAIWFYVLAMEPKYSKRKTLLLSILSAVLAEAISLWPFGFFESKQQSLTVTFYVASVTYAFFYIFLMQGGKKIKALFLYFSYIGIWSAMYVVVMIITRNVLGGWQPAMWILRSLFNIVLLIVYHRFLKARFIASLPAVEKASGVLILVSGMAYLLVPTLMIYYAYSTQTMMGLLMVMFLLLFCFAVYFLMFRFIRQVGRESELHRIEMQNKLLTETIQNFETAENETRRIRHDLRHHEQILAEYIKSGDTQAAIGYLSQYGQRE